MQKMNSDAQSSFYSLIAELKVRADNCTMRPTPGKKELTPTSAKDRKAVISEATALLE